ncbi:hypothetical protein COB11_05390 [Candidatus Aerophobetes bacterium]|uniref:Uncharacterized protein n=1 Tax=Aerophobetes bacterium TaxID=2030807 RepID=A0A2A4YGE3_UNCAE|nr:MAG: hypothetical protein COB11_05390 [Candidatus Aerophobetes bacterium]
MQINEVQNDLIILPSGVESDLMLSAENQVNEAAKKVFCNSFSLPLNKKLKVEAWYDALKAGDNDTVTKLFYRSCFSYSFGHAVELRAAIKAGDRVAIRKFVAEKKIFEQRTKDAEKELIANIWYEVLQSGDRVAIKEFLSGVVQTISIDGRRRTTFDCQTLLGACGPEDVDILRLLFENGFPANLLIGHNDLDIYDGWPCFVRQAPAAIHWIPIYRNLDTLRLFLEFGAEVNAYDGENYPLTRIMINKEPLKVLELLLSFGADPLRKDKRGNTIIQMLVSNNWKPHSKGLEEVILKFISLGVDINAENAYGKKAIDLTDSQETKAFLLRNS